MTKKQRKLFFAQAEQLLTELGAEKDAKVWYPWTLQTVAGPLQLIIENDTNYGLGTLFTRFDDPSRAKQIVRCNPYSGKWNFHFFDGWTVKAAIDHLRYSLESVLQSEVTTPRESSAV